MATVLRRCTFFRKTKNSFTKNLDYTNSSLQKSIKWVLVLAQMFALMPVSGISAKHVYKISFNWFSLRVIYTFTNIFGSFMLLMMNLLRFIRTGMQFGDFVSVIFYTSSMLAVSLFIKIAYNWSFLSNKWFEMEKLLHKYENQPNLRRRFIRTTAVVMLLALGEHLLFVSKLTLQTFQCHLSRSDPLKAYFGAAFAQIFIETEYTLWKALLLEYLNILATFVWNFMDLFIILMSIAMVENFRLINRRVQNADIKNEEFLQEIREHYNSLSLLCDDLDDVICHLVTLSFANNLFFICVQLFNSLQPIDGMIEKIYFYCSFGFLLARTAAVSIYGSWINDESRVLLPYLFELPSEEYGIEAKRLVQQINTSPIEISGSKYFYLNRNLCMTIAGAIITFELILQQMSPFMLNTKSNDNNNNETVHCLK